MCGQFVLLVNNFLLFLNTLITRAVHQPKRLDPPVRPEWLWVNPNAKTGQMRVYWYLTCINWPACPDFLKRKNMVFNFSHSTFQFQIYIYIYITIEISLSGGPIHFNCFPDFEVHLHDPHVMKALTLNIKTHGTLMVQGANQIALIYRVYYKCMRTNFNVQAFDKRRPKDNSHSNHWS